MRAPLALLAAALALTLGSSASAAVLRSESILPPGQSGFVAGPQGTPSPHLTDQVDPFVRFRWKSARFGQAGRTERPRPGVRIVRDRFGVPAVTGRTERDMWFGMGYAVAQDRLAEMELIRRRTSGRLAELLGQGELGADIEARRDFYTDAEIDRQFARLPAGLRARTAAYRDGVNAWVARVNANPALVPREFSLLNLRFAPWTTRDTARVGIFLARTVPSGDGPELENVEMLRTLGARGFEALRPLRVPGQISTIPASEGLFPSQPGRTRAQERAAFTRSQRFVRGLPLPPPDEGEPSEGGAASAAATASGVSRARYDLRLGDVRGSFFYAARRRSDDHTFLFNGPQLGFQIPELFVEVELHGPGFDMRGATAPGVPIIATGRNGRIAWGITSGLSDDDDLYAEQLVAGQPERYRFRGRVRSMRCRVETFRVAGGQPRTERLCRTVHGPVQERVGSIAYARRYAIWGRELETFIGLDMLNRARNVREADRAAARLTWNENLLVVDGDGGIGYWHPGLLPLRPLGYDERLPYPGTGQAEWRGFLPVAQRPHVINPRQGWLTNWNNIPSQGWTSGDAPADERLSGPFHRDVFLAQLVRRFARSPSFDGLKAVVRRSGTTAQQRPLATARLRAALAGSSGGARTVLNTILNWDGSYARTNAAGLVSPGVAAWEAFKDEAEKIALAPFGPRAVDFGGSTGTSHAFDVSNGEAYALRTLGPVGYRLAAERTLAALTAKFGSADPARWAEPRPLYTVTAQGVAEPPRLPFFDRGTFEHLAEVG